MLDIKWIKENQTAFDSLLKKRGVVVDSKELLNLDAENKKLKTSIQQLHIISKTLTYILPFLYISSSPFVSPFSPSLIPRLYASSASSAFSSILFLYVAIVV